MGSSTTLNPLHIELIVENVLKFLPLQDVKNYRKVSQSWKRLAKPLLGKKGKIIFKNTCSPSVFTDYFSQTEHQNLQPFNTFVFESIKVTLAELDTFFMKFGKHIKKLELLKSFSLSSNETNFRHIGLLDLDPFLELARNLEDLTISYWSHPFQLSIHLLTSIKNLCLEGGLVIFKPLEKRITPLKFHLKNVHCHQNIIINNFVDFSKCSDIYIKDTDPTGNGPNGGLVLSFDFSRDFGNCSRIRLDYVNALNCNTSKMTAEYFHLCYNSRNESQVAYNIPTKLFKIQLKFHSLSDLILISKNVQKLTLLVSNNYNENEIFDVEPLDLPNLKSLKISLVHWGTRTNIFKTMSLFANCNKLVELDLIRYDGFFTESELDISWIPKSVRKLNIGHPAARISLIGKAEPIHLDVLILYGSSIHVKNIMKRIKSKVLIRKVGLCGKNQVSEVAESVTDFLFYIWEEKETEKIVVEFVGFDFLSPGDKAILYHIVYRDSAHYEFVGQRGIAITQEEFNKTVNQFNSFECYPDVSEAELTETTIENPYLQMQL